MVLGRYLGPSMDIGPAMTAKILKPNGQVVHRSTLRPLTRDEWEDPLEIQERKEFDEAVDEMPITPRQLGLIGVSAFYTSNALADCVRRLSPSDFEVLSP